MNKVTEFAQGIVAAAVELNAVDLTHMSDVDRAKCLFDVCYINMPDMEPSSVIGEILAAGRGNCRRIDLLCGVKAEPDLCAVIDSAGCYYIVTTAPGAVEGYNRGVTPLSSKELRQFLVGYIYSVLRSAAAANGQVNEFDIAAQQAVVDKGGRMPYEILAINAYQDEVFATM